MRKNGRNDLPNWAETTQGRIDPGRNDPGRNDPGPKRLRAETTLGRNDPLPVGMATGSHVTALVNAVVPRLSIQLFIDKQLSIHYSYNHMIQSTLYLRNFMNFLSSNPPPTHLKCNHHSRSQFQFLQYLKCMLLAFSTLCGFCRPLCAYKMHYKHSKPHIKVHSGSPFQ